jgi:hypothetical protein
VSYTPSTITQTVASGYHNGLGKVIGDTDLVSGNVRGGIDLFGVSGDPNVADTSSGDAVSGEILKGKKAWVDGVEVTGTVPPAPVPRTGQTGCWAEPGTAIGCAGTGQDGEYQEGVAWPSPRFVTSTMGIVTDTLTGLVWLQNANCGGNQTWEDALTFANSLHDGWTGDGSGGDCGLSDGSSAGDWRLPNLRELQSLLDYSQYNPVLPSGHPFTGVQTYLYWSSTTRAYDTSQAWLVYLSHGTVSVAYKAIQYFSWPVRDGQ